MERETSKIRDVEDYQSRTPEGAACSGGSDAHALLAGGGGAAPLAPEVRILIGGIILAALSTLVFWEFLWRQVRFAIAQQADWGHTLVIPFIAGYFVYRNRDKILRSRNMHGLYGSDTPAPAFCTTWIAIVPIVVGVAAYLVSAVGPQAVNHHNLKGAGFGLALAGVVLLFAGFAAMRWLWFPLAYLVVFGQTISNEVMHLVTHRMQDIAAFGSEKLFFILGMDVSRVGNIVTLFYKGVEHPLNIAEACSGMRMLMAFMALGVAMAYTGLDRNWQRVLLVALAVPIAIFVNMLRVVTLGFLSIRDSEFAAGDFHTFVGLVWLVPAFLMFLGAMWAVKKIVVEEEALSAQSGASGQGERPVSSLAHVFDHRARRAFVVACATLLVSGVGFRIAVGQLNIYLTKEPVELREKFPTIPRTLAHWQAIGRDQQFDAAVVETLGTDEYLDRTYVRRDGGADSASSADSPGEAAVNLPVNLHLAYYTGMIDAVPHIPDRCFLAGGFVRAGLPEVVDAPLDASTWEIDPSGALNRATGQPYRVMNFEHRITGRPVSVRLPMRIGEREEGEGGAIRVRTTEFRVPGRPDARIFAGFFFIANGQVTPFPTEVRALAFDRTDRYAYYCKVQFTMEGGPNLTHAVFAEHVGQLLDDLLPEIMRCLPDWAEVEAEQRLEIRGQRSEVSRQ